MNKSWITLKYIDISHKFIKIPVALQAFSTSKSRSPSRYRCVMEMLECPIKRDRLYKSSPFFNCICAKVWRQVCGLTRISLLTPTALPAILITRCIASVVMGLPLRLRNTFSGTRRYAKKFSRVLRYLNIHLFSRGLFGTTRSLSPLP